LGDGGISTTYYSSTTTTKNLTGTANTFGIYPDFHDPCQQAMMAAQYAASQGTVVYAVAYGSESSGCTDTTIVPNTTAYNESFTASTIYPCVTVENIADSWKHFYYESSSTKCDTAKATNGTVTSLTGIFGAIGSSLGPGGRLLSNATQ
jgi:hypothetical protein